MTLQTNRFTPEQRAELEKRRGKGERRQETEVRIQKTGVSPLSMPPVQTKYNSVGVNTAATQYRGGCGGCGAIPKTGNGK